MLEGGGALALPAPAKTSHAAGGGGGFGGGPEGSLAPRVEVVGGEIRVVEASLTVHAQPLAGTRVVVEDRQVRSGLVHTLKQGFLVDAGLIVQAQPVVEMRVVVEDTHVRPEVAV